MYDNSLMYLYRASKLWIEETISRYSESLSNTKEKSHNDIMVYGRSQVGKTTFILKLIGINQNKYSELEHILRGGRPKGKSATAVATLYTHSDSQYFSLEVKNIKTGIFSVYENLSEEDTCKKIAEIRDSLRKWEPDKIIKIGIPSYFFDKEIVMNTQIIDFPGIGSDSQEEHRYIKAALLFYQLRVSTIILFELKNEIRSLNKPLKVGLRFDLNPSKYILVTTMSFSSSETKRKFKEENWTMEDIINKSRNDVLKELKKYSNYQFTRLPEYFPVEIGESLTYIIEKEGEYGTLLEKCMEETFDSVRQLIKSKNSDTLFNTIEEIRCGILRGYEDDIKKLSIEKEKKRKLITKLKRKIKRANIIIANNELKLNDISLDEENINEKIAKIEDVKEEMIDRRLINMISLSSSKNDFQKDHIKDMYRSFEMDYLEIQDRTSEWMGAFLDDDDQEEFEKKICDELDVIKNALKKKEAKEIWETKKKRIDFATSINNEINQTLCKIENIMKIYTREYLGLYRECLTDLKEQKELITYRIKKIEKNICKLEKRIKENESKNTDLDGKISNVKKYMIDQQNILEEILETANKICNKHKLFYESVMTNKKSAPEKRFMSYLVYKKICEDQDRMNKYYGTEI